VKIETDGIYKGAHQLFASQPHLVRKVCKTESWSKVLVASTCRVAHTGHSILFSAHGSGYRQAFRFLPDEVIWAASRSHRM
jgi:hypothetical protein